MKRRYAVLLMITLSGSSLVLADGFSGADSFNDGVVATNLWLPSMTMGAAGLIETNGHVHLTASSGPAQKGSWYMSYMPWRNNAQVDFDWQVQLAVTIPDLVNTSVQQYQMGFALTINDVAQAPVNRFDFLLCKNESNQKRYVVVITTNGVEVSDQESTRTADSSTIRIRWVASTRNLYTDVSLDGGQTWSNLLGPWYNPLGMKPTDTFVCMVGGGVEGGKGISVDANLYADDFRATASGPVITFFGNGEMAWTDQNTSSVFTVEWSPNLTGSWSRTWTNLTGIHMDGTNKTVSVPMFYRVVRDNQ